MPHSRAYRMLDQPHGTYTSHATGVAEVANASLLRLRRLGYQKMNATLDLQRYCSRTQRLDASRTRADQRASVDK